MASCLCVCLAVVPAGEVSVPQVVLGRGRAGQAVGATDTGRDIHGRVDPVTAQPSKSGPSRQKASKYIRKASKYMQNASKSVKTRQKASKSVTQASGLDVSEKSVKKRQGASRNVLRPPPPDPTVHRSLASRPPWVPERLVSESGSEPPGASKRNGAPQNCSVKGR